MPSCSARSAASRCSSSWHTFRRSPTRVISESSCCSMWPDVMACMLGLAFFAIEAVQQGLSSLISRPSVNTRISSSRKARSSSSNWRKTSRSSRFMESGPSARCLPPVTVTLWKHSPALREEEGVRILQSQTASDVGFRNDVAVAQLGQNHFQRLAKTVQHSNGVLQRDDLSGGRRAVRGLIEHEGELGLRVFRMHQERRAAIHAGAQHRRPSSAASQDFTTT